MEHEDAAIGDAPPAAARDVIPQPGLVVVQMDGLSRPVLERFLADGRMPVLKGLIGSGRLSLEGWTPLLPPCTPASQAGILHGQNDEIPGFRWFEKASRRLMVANHLHDAAEIERRTSNGQGLLARDGASIGNLLAGDAAFSHLTLATMEDETTHRGPTDAARFTLDPRRWVRIVVESFTELLREVVQARRQRVQDVEPRMPRGLRYAVERVVANVPLRILSTDLVRREIALGRRIVYVDFTGYDEIAHHCGPGREETAGAAARIDASIGEIVEAIDGAPRPYALVVLSDHGQSLGWTFYQRFGITLEELIASSTGERRTYHGATWATEYDNGLARLLHHVSGHRLGPAIAGFAERRPGRSHHRPSRLVDSRGAPLANPADAQEADVVVCASGNLALVYLTDMPGRATRETLEARHPDLVPKLVEHPGVGFVVLRTGRGVEAVGRHGTRNLEDGSITGADPLEGYGNGVAVRACGGSRGSATAATSS
jgi:hypothetical protein